MREVQAIGQCLGKKFLFRKGVFFRFNTKQKFKILLKNEHCFNLFTFQGKMAFQTSPGEK
jgi:hypothetical protein